MADSPTKECVIDASSERFTMSPEIKREYGCEYGCPLLMTRLELLRHMLECPRHEVKDKYVRAEIVRQIEAEENRNQNVTAGKED